MLLFPLLPEFLVFECEGKICLSHLKSNTVMYAHKYQDSMPDDMEEHLQHIEIKDIVSPYSIEVLLIALMSDKVEKELELILNEAAQWYMDYTALAAFKAQNDLLKNATS